jgi:uncharacterized membrane protein (DUF485 family)
MEIFNKSGDSGTGFDFKMLGLPLLIGLVFLGMYLGFIYLGSLFSAKSAVFSPPFTAVRNYSWVYGAAVFIVGAVLSFWVLSRTRGKIRK